MKNIGKRATVLSLILFGVLAAAPSAARAKKHRSPGDADQPGSYLVRSVGHELRMLPYYSVFDNLEYKVDGYNVELFGQVTRPTLKSDAERVVKRIEGVERVTNHIKVLPLSPFDDRIRRSVYRAIYRQPSLQRYAIQPVPPIHIIVDHGHVTLVGVVANEMDKTIARLQTNGVPGVFSVTDKLAVER